jgi:rubrerythrin
MPMASRDNARGSTVSPSLMDALRIAKDNEKAAAELYGRSATSAGNSNVRKLFEQLTEFEQMHYARLTELEKSLTDSGAFINYDGTDFVVPPDMVIKVPELPDKASTMTIISKAADLETRAESAYRKLAAMTTDVRGHQMFDRLADEEHKHYLTLKEVYWALNNLGKWEGPTG